MKLQTRTTILAGLMLAAVAAHAAIPTGAYVRRPVSSVSDLVKHINTDAIVADRYVRHFRMDKAAVTAYIGGLREGALSNSGMYTVYNVHGGVLRSRVLSLKKGSRVFADQTGRPILLKVCGNPMVWSVPPIGTEPQVGESAQAIIDGAADPAESVVLTAPTAQPSVMEIPPPPIPPDVPPTITASRRDNFLPLLLLGAGAIALSIPKDDDCPPVPEPATMLALAAGSAIVMKRRRKK